MKIFQESTCLLGIKATGVRSTCRNYRWPNLENLWNELSVSDDIEVYPKNVGKKEQGKELFGRQ
jgi:hypothetical protein